MQLFTSDQTTPWFGHLTVDEEESRDRIPGKSGVGATAHLARHVLHDILPQKRLDVLGYVLACDSREEQDLGFLVKGTVVFVPSSSHVVPNVKVYAIKRHISPLTLSLHQ